MSSPDHWKSRTLLLVAAAIVAGLMFIPYGWLVVYPFRLFGTFIHETGHAVAAVATGGYVESMVVNLDTSGYVKSAGGFRPLVASAGYLGSIAVGAALLLAGRKRDWAKKTLIVLGAITLVATAVFSGYGGAGASLIAFLTFGLGLALIAFGKARQARGGDDSKYVAFGGIAVLGSLLTIWLLGGLLTWMIGLAIGGACLFVAFYAGRLVQHLTVLFLGVQISLDGLNSVQVLWNLTSRGHDHNDAANMAQATGLPAEFWAITWGVMGLAVVAGAFWLFWRTEQR